MDMLLQLHTEDEWDAARLKLHDALTEVKADRGRMKADGIYWQAEKSVR